MANFLRFDGRWYRLLDREVEVLRSMILANSGAGERYTFPATDLHGNSAELFYTPGVAVTITETRTDTPPDD